MWNTVGSMKTAIGTRGATAQGEWAMTVLQYFIKYTQRNRKKSAKVSIAFKIKYQTDSCQVMSFQ